MKFMSQRHLHGEQRFLTAPDVHGREWGEIRPLLPDSDSSFETSNPWASGEFLPIHKGGRVALSSWDLPRLQVHCAPQADLVASAPFTSGFVVCFFNDFCSNSCGNLQVKLEPNPRCGTFLQSFAPHKNCEGRATEFPSQGQQPPLLSWSLPKWH